MRRARPTYIWRKAASPSWLGVHEPRLHAQTGGAYAVIEWPGRQRLVVEVYCDRLAKAGKLRARFGGTTTALAADWVARAFAAGRMKPLRVGKRLTIAGDAEEIKAEGAGARLVIPAGVAFGTGGHATTAMSLRLLERITRPYPAGWRMLDLGTGSGILALAGKRFGAGDIVAIDNDPLCISTAKANARANKIADIEFRLADATRPQRGKFDLVCANLYSELLARTLPLLRRNLRPRARLIVSGVMRTQEAGIVTTLRKNGYRIDETRRRGKWIAVWCSAKT